MFGKPHDSDDTATIETNVLDEFFGDEAAAANAIEVRELHERVGQVEAQISSQFTSLATYAQIAQEQIELARAEARAATERSEQRVTSLIERERADRISSFTGRAPAGSAPDVMARIEAVEHSVAQIRKGLDECVQRQKSLAEAITTMFERLTTATPARTMSAGSATTDDDEPADERAGGADLQAPAPLQSPSATPLPSPSATPLPSPTLPSPVARQVGTPLSGPIADLSLNG
jgi:hypothetical protein